MRIDRPTGFLSRFRTPSALALPDPREVRERERAERILGEAVARLREAASALEARAPEAKIEIQLDEQTRDGTRSVVVGTVEQEIETTTPAAPGRQYSTAFASDSTDIAVLGSELQLRFGKTKLDIEVETVTASLADIAQLLNDDAQNTDLVTASIVEGPEGFRLQIETVATGAGNDIGVKRDDFTSPTLEDFALLDPALAESGSDEITTTETVEVPVTETQGVTTRVTQEVEVTLPDGALEAALEDFVDSYNELRSAVEAASGIEGLALDVDQAKRAVGEIGSAFDADGADAGIDRASDGAASLDRDALQAAVAGDAERLDAVLRDAEAGLSTTTTEALAPVEAEPRAPDAGASGLLSRLGGEDPDAEPGTSLLERLRGRDR